MPTLALVLWVAFQAAPAGASHLERARDLVRGVRYAAAVAELQKAEAEPDHPADALAEIYELEGVAYASLKQPEEARAAFTRLVALKPEHRLADSYAPRVMTAYLEARAAVNAEGALGFELRPWKALDAQRFEVVLEVQHDFLKLGKTVEVTLEEDGVPRTVTRPAAAEVALEAHGAHVTLRARLLGAARAVLKALGPISLDAAPAHEPQLPPASADAGRTPPGEAGIAEPAPGPRRWPLAALGALAVVGLSVAATGAYFGSVSRADRTQLLAQPRDGTLSSLTWPQAQQLNTQMVQYATIANTLFGVGAGVLLTGLLVWLIGSLT
jgi:hypothetical protein